MTKTYQHKVIEAPPRATRTFKALSNIGYDFNSAIADIIDNSIDAGANNIYIDFQRKGNKTSFLLRDDGRGMTKSELREAMHLGSDEEYDEHSLGKFGMGLKTASLSQCRRLIVVSNAQNSMGGLNAYCWDMAEIERTNEWQLLEMERDWAYDDHRFREIRRSKGTIILWEELAGLDRELAAYERGGNAKNKFYEHLTNLELHLRMTFHRFLDGSLGPTRSIRLFCNKNKLTAWDPFCLKETHPKKFDAVTFIPDESEGNRKCSIRIQPYVLPDQTSFSSDKAWQAAKGLLPLNDSQGLYMYRGDRIIHFGGWLHTRGKNPHAAYARTAVDFTDACDALFDVDVRKRNLRLPASIFDKIKAVTAESVGFAIKMASKSPPKNGGLHGRSSNAAAPAMAKAMDKFKVQIKEGAHNRVQVINKNGSFQLPREAADYEALLETPVVPGNVADGALWKIVPRKGGQITVVLNVNHPFYKAVYDGTSSKLTKSMDSVFLAMAITQICSGTEETLEIFDEVRGVVSTFLGDIAKTKGFVGKGHFGPRKPE